MNRFLEKQYKAMMKREEQKLAEYNLGKIKEHKKTLEQFVKPDFAYTETSIDQGAAHNNMNESQGGGFNASGGSYSA